MFAFAVGGFVAFKYKMHFMKTSTEKLMKLDEFNKHASTPAFFSN